MTPTAVHSRLTNPDRWERVPHNVSEALSEWAEGQAVHLTLERWLSGGISGAHVAMIHVEPEHGMLHGAILKLVPQALAIKESRGLSLAKQCSPNTFYQEHMVHTIPTALPHCEWWMQLGTAPDDLTQVCLLADLAANPEFSRHCETVVSTIIERWNPDGFDSKAKRVAIADYLRKDLEPKRDLLQAFAALTENDLERASVNVVIPGRAGDLPNPLALFNGDLCADDTITVFTGNGHGDLHPRNVLMPIVDNDLNADAFRLIDFGRFLPDMPISRDPVKLMLSVSGLWLPDLAPRSKIRSQLAELVVRPSSCDPYASIAGYHDVLNRVYRAAAAWGSRRHLGQAWMAQHLLVLIASALRTVARDDIDIDDRWWFFEVAALATRELLGKFEAR